MQVSEYDSPEEQAPFKDGLHPLHRELNLPRKTYSARPHHGDLPKPTPVALRTALTTDYNTTGNCNSSIACPQQA